MNDLPSEGSLLEQTLARRLREILGFVTWLKNAEVEVVAGKEPCWDLVARISMRGGRTALLAVECKKELRPSQFPMLVARFAQAPKPASNEVRIPVLALPWISPRMEELCREQGWGWYDLAGNCHLDVPGLFHISRSGHPPVHEVPKPKANLGSWAAAAVISTLLDPVRTRRTKTWTQRAMATATFPEVSVGLVNKVINHLIDEAFVQAEPKGGFRLTEPLRLLEAWRGAYRFDKHERAGYFTLLNRRQLMEKVCQLEEEWPDIAYAAFSAADFQAPNVRQPKTWLYVTHRLLHQFLASAGAKKVDSGENLVLLIPANECVLAGMTHEKADGLGVPCTDLVQTYVDLWHCGGRGQEAAEAILEQRLKPAWKEAGLKV